MCTSPHDITHFSANGTGAGLLVGLHLRPVRHGRRLWRSYDALLRAGGTSIFFSFSFVLSIFCSFIFSKHSSRCLCCRCSRLIYLCICILGHQHILGGLRADGKLAVPRRRTHLQGAHPFMKALTLDVHSHCCPLDFGFCIGAICGFVCGHSFCACRCACCALVSFFIFSKYYILCCMSQHVCGIV